MTHARIVEGEPIELDGFSSIVIGDVAYPPNITVLWPPEDLRALDIYQIIEQPIPDGFVADGFTLELDAEGQHVNRVPNLVPAPVNPEVVPNITPRQLRLWLLQNGITRAMVEQKIADIPDAAEREAAEIEWEYATGFVHTHPLVQMFGADFGLNEQQIKDGFKAASTL